SEEPRQKSGIGADRTPGSQLEHRSPKGDARLCFLESRVGYHLARHAIQMTAACDVPPEGCHCPRQPAEHRAARPNVHEQPNLACGTDDAPDFCKAACRIADG